MRAVTGKSPAVVKSPYHSYIRFFEILKKNTDIQIISMNIMQMYYIRLEFLYDVYELNSSSSRLESVAVGDSRQASVYVNVYILTDPVRVHSFRMCIPSVCDKAFISVGGKSIVQSFDKSSYRSGTHDGIYKDHSSVLKMIKFSSDLLCLIRV